MSVPSFVAVYRLATEPRLQVVTDPNTRREVGVLRLRLAANSSRYNTYTHEFETTERLFIDADLVDKGAVETYHLLHKGDLVVVEGHLVTDEWRNPADGARRSRIKIKARKVYPATQPPHRKRDGNDTAADEPTDPATDTSADH